MRYPYVRVPVETEEAPAQWSKDVDHERRRHQLLLCSSDNVVSFHAPQLKVGIIHSLPLKSLYATAIVNMFILRENSQVNKDHSKVDVFSIVEHV